MGRFATGVAFGTLLAIAAYAEDPKSDEAPSVSAAELQARRESGTAPVVIDVRTPDEYAAGHIPGALNIPFDQVAQRIAEIDAPDGVALYCMVGPRARKGESALLAAGYQTVFHLEGGLAAWQAAGLPVEGTREGTP
jgi:phage shock protein E